MQIQHNDEIFKCYINSTVFNAQYAGNRISELLDFTLFWGEGHALRPPYTLGERVWAAVTAKNTNVSNNLESIETV